MIKKTTRTLCLLFAILCLTQLLAYGQEEPEEDQSGKAQVAADTLLVLNGADQLKLRSL